MSNLLSASKIAKDFPRASGGVLQILNGIDLEVQEGDRVAILGKSGVGKSTLLHILGTLEAPSQGSILFQGKDVFKWGESQLSSFRNQQLGFVFQFHYLMLEFTAIENIMMPAIVAGQSKKKARPFAEKLLSRVGLSERKFHKPAQLSGGEQQRVAIARALMNAPKLLLTDEMTGNLDPATGKEVFEMVQEIHAEQQMALISVTHDEALAAHYPNIYRLTPQGLVPGAVESRE